MASPKITRRLDDASIVVVTRVLMAGLIVFILVMSLVPGRARESPPALFYIFYGIVSVVLVLWMRRMRQVSFDGEQFVIKDWFAGAVEVPKSHLVSVRAVPVNKGLSWLTLKFDPPTKYGAAVRVMTGESWQTDKFLRLAEEMRAIAEKRPPRKHVSKSLLHDAAIEVRGWSKQEAEKIVADFATLYGLTDFPATVANSAGSVVDLRFPTGIAPDQFLFLVNYLHYPKDVDIRGRTVSARGTCVLTPDFKLPSLALVGHRATIVVPPNDTDYDVVMATVDSGTTYRIPFTSLRWQLVGGS